MDVRNPARRRRRSTFATGCRALNPRPRLVGPLSEQPVTTQVLVVGAGPVGMTMASELARYGVRVRIVDKAAHRTDRSKALVLWSRTLELFDRADCGDMFVAAGHKVLAANIVAGDTIVGRLGMATVESPHRYALMLPQSETERLLEEHLHRQGIRVEREVEVTTFTAGAGGVGSVLRARDGREERLETEWLIGCDGAHSTVRHALGLSFRGNTLQSEWVLADIHLEGVPFPESEIVVYWHAEGALVVLPISPGRCRVLADIGPSNGDPAAEPTLEQVQAIIDRRGPRGLVASDPVWLSSFRINERMVPDYRAGRVFLAGDAAHVHSPAGGQGMNTGMHDAFNLAWKLALVCRGRCSDELLESYSIERSAVAEQVLAASGRLTKVAVLKGRVQQAVRNTLGHALLGLAPVRRAIVNNMTEVAIHYVRSPLNGPRLRGIAGPVPGERVAPIAGQVPPGSGDAPRFALCAASDGALVELLATFKELIDPHLRPPLHAGGMWLVRPDGYAACVAADGDAKVVADYLGRLR
ncbi:MAG: FAD-dependent monooxygenase [Phycisphaerales bacterium]